jgi:hypothetical protein
MKNLLGLPSLALIAVLIPVQPGLAADAITVTLNQTNGSNTSGTATLTPEGNQTKVVIEMQGAPTGAVQPVHFHKGTCDKLEPKPVYPLQDIKNGTSTTVVPVEMSMLTATPYTINVHKSAAEMNTSVACGEVKE